MTRMTGPDCAVMCNLINTNTHHTHTHSLDSAPRSIIIELVATFCSIISTIHKNIGLQFCSIISTIHKNTSVQFCSIISTIHKNTGVQFCSCLLVQHTKKQVCNFVVLLVQNTKTQVRCAKGFRLQSCFGLVVRKHQRRAPCLLRRL